MKKVDFKVGKLWLNLAWLYQDMKDDKMVQIAYKTALENYTYVLYNSRVDIMVQEEQKLYMLIGEMYLKDGNNQEAIKFYQKAVQRDAKGMLADEARNRIYDVRQAMKEKEKMEAEAAAPPAEPAEVK